jgi:hypothetical protein
VHRLVGLPVRGSERPDRLCPLADRLPARGVVRPLQRALGAVELPIRVIDVGLGASVDSPVLDLSLGGV